MRPRVYRHLSTALIALVVSVLAGGGAAIATNAINGNSIVPGTVGEGKLKADLRTKIDRIESAASNVALNSHPRLWQEDIQRAIRRLEGFIEAEYVHQP